MVLKLQKIIHDQQYFSGFKNALSHENMGHSWDMEMFEQLVVHNYKAGVGPKVNETHRHK